MSRKADTARRSPRGRTARPTVGVAPGARAADRGTGESPECEHGDQGPKSAAVSAKDQYPRATLSRSGSRPPAHPPGSTSPASRSMRLDRYPPLVRDAKSGKANAVTIASSRIVAETGIALPDDHAEKDRDDVRRVDDGAGRAERGSSSSRADARRPEYQATPSPNGGKCAAVKPASASPAVKAAPI